MTDPSVRLDSIERAVADIAPARAVVVVDDETARTKGTWSSRPAWPPPSCWRSPSATPAVSCAPMEGAALDRLALPQMTPHNNEAMRTAFTVSVDARDGVTTGISAADRAHTISVLADPATGRRPGAARPRLPAALPAWRCARPTRPHRSGGRPGAAGRAAGRGRDLRAGQRRRDHAPWRAAAGVRRRARPGAGLDRGPGPLPRNARECGRAGRHGAAADRDRDFTRDRLPRTWSTARARRAGPRRPRRRARRAGAGALRVSDRRRVRLPPMRLRATAARRHGGVVSRRPRRRGLPPRSRGPRHRAAPQAAGLHAAGRRPRHRRRQPRARAARPTPATTPPVRRSCTTSACTRCT